MTRLVALCLLLTLPGCAFLRSEKGLALTDILARKGQCVLKYMDRKPVEWLALCGLEEEDLEQFEKLASTARAERDAAIQRDRAEAGACRPSR